jgi:DNA-binding GntR family transcriptional regulator
MLNLTKGVPMTGAITGSGVSRLSGLAKTSLREQALDVLRNAVTSGEIAPGTHLVETELSSALSISRGTLREALRQLEQEGLVEPSERGRLRVRTVSAAEIGDMFEVRSALEGLAAALLCKMKNRKTVVRQLQTALDALGAATGSIHDMVEIDLDFHRTMCTLTGNAALLRSWEGIAGSIRMSIMFAGTDRALSNMSVPRHQVLVDAVAAGDPDQARIAVDEHMREAAFGLIEDHPDPDASRRPTSRLVPVPQT